MSTLILGNCIEVMAGIATESVDLVLTSPPYDGLRQYNGYVFDFEAVAQGLQRILKPGGVIVWVVNDETVDGSESGTSFRQALFFKEIGLRLHDTMIYAKRNPIPRNHRRYEQAFEFMFVFSKGAPATVNLLKEKSIEYGRVNTGTMRHAGADLEAKHGTKKPVLEYKTKSNIWTYNVGIPHSTDDKEAYKHPAIFPEALASDHIMTWTNEGDLVFDPFTGSGTTGKIAVQLRRRFIGAELSAEYHEIAMTRIKRGHEQPGLLL